jgi:hypothetical protein
LDKHDLTVKGKAVPLQAWTGSEGSRKLMLPDFVTTAQDGGKVVSLTHWPLFTPRKYSWYSILLEAESTPGTPAGIKPTTFRFVAQQLNHCATAVPPVDGGTNMIFWNLFFKVKVI